jgi:hypothetical protein
MRIARQSFRFHSRSLALLALLLAILVLGAPVAAQQELIGFEVAKYTCATDPGTISPTIGEIPADCATTAGVAFTIEVAGGEILSCTTDETGICNVRVPNGATVTVTEDTATAPASYAPRQNPIVVEEAMTEFAGAVFVNLPVAPDTNEVPTELPETGSGGPGDAGSGTVGVLATLATLALVAGHLTHRGTRP